MRGVAILQGAEQMTALIDGKVNGQVVFDPSPLAAITSSVNGFVTTDFTSTFGDLPKARLLCLPGAFTDAAAALSGVATNTTATISAQAKFAAIFTA